MLHKLVSSNSKQNTHLVTILRFLHTNIDQTAARSDHHGQRIGCIHEVRMSQPIRQRKQSSIGREVERTSQAVQKNIHYFLVSRRGFLIPLTIWEKVDPKRMHAQDGLHTTLLDPDSWAHSLSFVVQHTLKKVPRFNWKKEKKNKKQANGLLWLPCKWKAIQFSLGCTI